MYRSLGEEEGPAAPPMMLEVELGAAVAAWEVKLRGGAQVIGAASEELDIGRRRGVMRRVAAVLPTGQMRLFSALLLAGLAGACVSARMQPVLGDGASGFLREELRDLRRRHEELEERARLAEEARDDLAHVLLNPQARARERLANLMARSRAFDEFAVESGFESTPKNTASVRRCLGKALPRLQVASLLDVSCGDGSWQHLIPGVGNVTYVGADISPKALDRARRRPQNRRSGAKYQLFDAVHFPLKRAFDLVLFRDIVEQQRIQDTLTALLNFKGSGSRYLAATYWPATPAEVNREGYRLEHAGWYEVNLLKRPFYFPDPLFSCDNVDEGSDHRGQSRLGFWRLQDLPVAPAMVAAASPYRPRRKVRLAPQVHVLHHPTRAPLASGDSSGSEASPSEEEEGLTQTEKRFKQELLSFLGGALVSRPAGPPRARPPPEAGDAGGGLLGDFLETAGPATEASVRGGAPEAKGGAPEAFVGLLTMPGFSAAPEAAALAPAAAAHDEEGAPADDEARAAEEEGRPHSGGAGSG